MATAKKVTSTRVQELAPGNNHEVLLEEVRAGEWVSRKAFQNDCGIVPVWGQRMLSQGRKGIVAGKLEGRWFVSKYFVERYAKEMAQKDLPGMRATGNHEKPTIRAIRMVGNMVTQDADLDDTARDVVLELLRKYKEQYDTRQELLEELAELDA